MKSIYEQADGTYIQQGNYELPALKVPPEKKVEIGVWGQRYQWYLKRSRCCRGNIIFIFRKMSADFSFKISFGFGTSCDRKGAIPTL